MKHLKRYRILLWACPSALLMCLVSYVIYDSISATSPYRNLAGNVSSAKSEMKDVEVRISQMIREKQAMLPELTGETPLLGEIPEASKDWIRCGDGKPMDPFQKDGRYAFARLESGVWFILSYGPDRDRDIGVSELQQWNRLSEVDLEWRLLLCSYDPTNGALSGGDLWRMGGVPFEGAHGPKE